MKRFGSFKPLDSVVSQDKLANLHVAVSSVSELTEEYPNNTIAVFIKADGIYDQGDVAVKKNGTWTKLKTHLATVGPVTNLRGFRLDKKVYLKYKSPADSVDNRGNITARWGKEIVVRKYGSVPTTEYDGTVVRVVTRKNVFNDNASQYLVDYIPDADKDSQWYYRVFVVADNGKIDYVHTAPGITIYDMPWSNVIEAVRNGHASKIFSVGDAFRLDDGNELVIADMTTRSPYRITLLLKYPRYMMPFDGVKGGYRLTRDTRVVARKTYYAWNPQSQKYEPEFLYSGTPITSSMRLYEAVWSGIASKGDGGRILNGCNRWSISDIRYWMNITSYASITSADKEFMRLHGGEITEEEFNDPSIIPDSKPMPPYLYLKRYQPDILECIATTTCKTSLPTVDGVNMEETKDKFFIPSYTEITGEKNNGAYAEGTQLALYAERLESGIHKHLVIDDGESSFVDTECFTRSPYLGDSSNGFQLLPTYGGEARLMMAKDDGSILVAFNIG